MKLSNKPNIAVGIFLLVLSAFFSIAFMLQLLDFGSFGRGNLFFFTGKMLSTVYGFSSALIPLFLLSAALSCFASTWTVRRSVGLLTAAVPFFTSATVEKICRAVYEGASPFFELKIALTLAAGTALIVIEFLAARLFADKIAVSPAFKENFPDFEECSDDVESKPHRLWNFNFFRANTQTDSERRPESQQTKTEKEYERGYKSQNSQFEEQSQGIHSDSQAEKDAEKSQRTAEQVKMTEKDAQEPDADAAAVPVNEPVQKKDDPFQGVFDRLEQPAPETVITKEEYAALTTPSADELEEQTENDAADEIEELEWPDAYQIKAQAGNPEDAPADFPDDDFIPPEADDYFAEEASDVPSEEESPYAERIEPDFLAEDERSPFAAANAVSPSAHRQNTTHSAEYLASAKPVLTDPYADGQDAEFFAHIREQERKARADEEACFTELTPPLPPEPNTAGKEVENTTPVKKNDSEPVYARTELDPEFFDIDMNAETQDELEAQTHDNKIQFQTSSDVFADMEADALQEVLAEQKTQHRTDDTSKDYAGTRAQSDTAKFAENEAETIPAQNNAAAVDDTRAERTERERASDTEAKQERHVPALQNGDAETEQQQDKTPQREAAAFAAGETVFSAPYAESPHFQNAVSDTVQNTERYRENSDSHMETASHTEPQSSAGEPPAQEETYITVRRSAIPANDVSAVPSRQEEAGFRSENGAPLSRAVETAHTALQSTGDAGQSSLYIEENEREDSQAFANDEGAANTPAVQSGFKQSGVIPKPPYSVPADLLTAFKDDQYWIIDDETKADARRLKSTLNEFRIEAEIIGIKKGPVVTMFELLPAHGVKLSKIVTLQDNIALRLAASSVRIVAPIPGRAAVGIEVPNKKRSIVSFREMIEQDLPEFKSMSIPVVLGKDILGKPQLLDLVKTPHLLIAGATGAGKSVCVNSMILSILYKRSAEQVRLILIDPKIVELKLYNDIPHLLTPVITEPKRAFQSLQYCLCEMERRYSLLDGMGVRDITSYNTRIRERNICTEKLPYIVVIIDEFADLMATTGKELESTVARLAAMSRAVGIHLVLATQRPSIDVITGLIKANIPSRIAFMVASKMDSRIIIDQVGAEMLLGKGDMLYASAVDPFPVRIQGTFVSDTDVENVVEYVKGLGAPDYIDDEIFVDDEESSSEQLLFQDGADPLYEEALDIVIQSGKASASYIQRKLKIGYNRAARLIEEMEERGIVGPANGSKPREIVHVPS